MGGNDILSGNGGNDQLDGGIGADTMSGGTGSDIYFVDDVGDSVFENAGEGTDEVRTTLSAYTLGANVEKLRFTGSGGFAGTGNALNNEIHGGASADTLIGGDGWDYPDRRRRQRQPVWRRGRRHARWRHRSRLHGGQYRRRRLYRQQ